MCVLLSERLLQGKFELIFRSTVCPAMWEAKVRLAGHQVSQSCKGLVPLHVHYGFAKCRVPARADPTQRLCVSRTFRCDWHEGALSWKKVSEKDCLKGLLNATFVWTAKSNESCVWVFSSKTFSFQLKTPKVRRLFKNKMLVVVLTF